MTKSRSKTKTSTRAATRSAGKSKPRSRSAHLSKITARADTKHGRILAILRTPAGATIAALMTATGWQQHGRSLASISFLSRPTRAESIGLRTTRLVPGLPGARSRRPDPMRKKRQNRAFATEASIEDEIVHLRGLDLKGLRAPGW